MENIVLGIFVVGVLYVFVCPDIKRFLKGG